MRIWERRIGGSICLHLTLLLVALHPAVSQPLTENENDIAALPPDADNVEFHHVKVVNGVMHEDHPVVMYKEDFVNEDYDPSKNESKVNEHKKHTHTQRIRHHRSRPGVEKHQKKILFDVLPESPIVMTDDEDSGVDKFEVASLVQPSNGEDLKSRRPREAEHRQRKKRWQSYSGYISNRVVHQPNPNVFRQSNFVEIAPNSFAAYQPNHVIIQPSYRYSPSQKPPKLTGSNRKGNPPTPSSIDNRLGPEDGFGGLIHNANPNDADFSVYSTERPSGNNNNNFEGWTPQQADRVPWGASAPRPTTRAPGNVPSFGAFGPPAASRPSWTTRRPARPSSRQEGLVYPKDPIFELGSSCQRASKLCCRLGNLGSLYDCFQHQSCDHSFAEILEACS